MKRCALFGKLRKVMLNTLHYEKNGKLAFMGTREVIEKIFYKIKLVDMIITRQSYFFNPVIKLFIYLKEKRRQ
jgi:hypothetical protein